MGLGRHTAVSDTGRKRRHNEDSYVVRPPLFAVADGMGGARAGETAARLAAVALEESGRGAEGEDALVALIVEANRVTDDEALWLSRDIAKKIEAELQYPGQIKVTVIRETRSVEYAR